MDPTDYVQFAFALIFVLGLIGIVGYLLRRCGPGGLTHGVKPGTTRRLQVIDTVALDPRRRLLLVRRDDTEHLLLLGPQTDCIVETGIKAPPQVEKEPDREATIGVVRRFDAMVQRIGAANTKEPASREDGGS